MAAEKKTEAAPMRWYRGLTGYHWLVLAVAALGWAFDTMDQWIFVFTKSKAVAALVGLEAGDPHVADLVGRAQAIFIVGWATGGFLFVMIGDKLGRTRTMMITVGMYAIFTGLSGLSQAYWQFALLRFLTGLGIGGEFAAGAALVAEVFPDYARPTALGIMQACSALGGHPRLGPQPLCGHGGPGVGPGLARHVPDRGFAGAASRGHPALYQGARALAGRPGCGEESQQGPGFDLRAVRPCPAAQYGRLCDSCGRRRDRFLGDRDL